MEKKEFIVCSAIFYNDGEYHDHQPVNIKTGFVVTGLRHCNCYATVASIVGIDEAIKMKIVRLEPSRKDQGFITNTHRYVDRKEGMRIAKSANQLINPVLHEDNDEAELTSEDLF